MLPCQDGKLLYQENCTTDTLTLLPSSLPPLQLLWIFRFSFIHSLLLDLCRALGFYNQLRTHTLNPHWHLFSFLKKPSMRSPQGLCTCCALCLERSPPRSPQSSHLTFFRSSLKCLPYEVLADQRFKATNPSVVLYLPLRLYFYLQHIRPINPLHLLFIFLMLARSH